MEEHTQTKFIQARMADREIKELADEIRAQLGALPAAYPEYSISRAPKERREAHRAVFVPKTISIGPLHHSKRHLKTMDEHKRCYTKSFLQQTPHLMIEDYLRAMQGLEEQARRCYGEHIELNSKQFKNMMLYDGCFIIELLLRFNKETSGSIRDPIFSRIGLLKRIKHDLILYENQLPFFVLQCLFNISAAFNGGPSLIDLAQHFFSDVVPGHKRVDSEKGPDIKHLLDLLRHSYAPSVMHPFDDEPEQVLLHGATGLKLKAAIKFRTSNADSLLDISFHSNGSIKIPRLKLQDETETLFHNLIAFEQCCERSNTYIIDYISFMGGLVKDWDDANLLCDIGIIENDLPNGPIAVADLFGTLRKDIIIHSCHYSRLCKRVNLHCISPKRQAVDTLLHYCPYLFYAGILLIFWRLIGFRPLLRLVGIKLLDDHLN